MILQQNYLRIAEYSQKTFRIYCRRALGIAIIKSYQKKDRRDNIRLSEQPEDINNTYPNKFISQKSIALCSAVYQESDKADSMVSEIKKSQAVIDKNQKNVSGNHTEQHLKLYYGIYIRINYSNQYNQNQMMMKCLLGKIIALETPKNILVPETDMRSIFQIVHPNKHSFQTKEPIIYNKSIFCLRNVSTKQYICALNKANIGEEFGMSINTTKVINSGCVFKIQNQDFAYMQAYTGSKFYIKHASMDRYLCISQKRYETQMHLSSIPQNIIFEKQHIYSLTNNSQICYFYIRNILYQATLQYHQPKFNSLFSYKTYQNSFSVNQLGVVNKINPIISVQYNRNKNYDKGIEIFLQKQINDCCIWQIITDRSSNNKCFIYNPIIKMGLCYKIVNSKPTFRLTPHSQQFTPFCIQNIGNRIIICNESRFSCLQVSQDRQQGHMKLRLQGYSETNKAKYFEVIQVSKKKVALIKGLSEIYESLLICFQFFNQWGLSFQKKTENVYYSVKQISLNSAELLIKIKQLGFIIRKISTYFIQYSECIQQTARSTHVLNIMIQICKIFMHKIWSEKGQQSNQESPYYYAKNNIEQVLIQVLLIIMKIVANNQVNSNIIISQVQFFNRLLLHYPQYVGIILQETIKNLTLFTTQNISNNTNQIFLWVKLIQPIKQDTILIQKTYIDIISQVVVDPHDKGIITYQNKCKQLIFIQGPSKKKGIPKFGFNEDLKKPYIIFEDQNGKSQFLIKNPLLQKINVLEDQPTTFFIQSFFVQKHNLFKSIYDNYIKYIYSVIRLFRNLTKDRNKKLIKIISDWGITHDHLFYVLMSRKINWELKSVYLDLYLKIYIDQDPFLPFENRQSVCHCWDKIKSYNLLQRTCMIFKQYTNEGLAYTRLNQHSFKLSLILNSFFTDFYRKGSSFLNDPLEIECLLRLLKIVYEAIKFGFLTLQQIKYYIGIILMILNCVKNRTIVRKNSTHEIRKITNQIIGVLVKILSIYEQIWVQIYGISFLQDFYRQYIDKQFNKTYQIDKERWMNIIKNTFKDPFESILLNTELQRKKTKAKLDAQNYQGDLEQSLYKIPSLSKITYNQSYEQIDSEIIEFLVNLLCKNFQKFYDFNYSSVAELLNKKIQRVQSVCYYLKDIMILNSHQEEQIYKNFNGRQPNKLLNRLKIRELINKIRQCEVSAAVQNQNQKRKKQKILQLNNTLVKIIREINNYRGQSCTLFKKSQQILCKLKIHVCLLQILKFREKKIYKQVIQTIFQFFHLFIIQNTLNCQIISEYLPTFCLKINNQIFIEIIPKLFNYCKNQKLAVINLINCLRSSKQQYRKHIFQIIYQLLRSMDKTKNSMKSLRNQVIDYLIEQIDKMTLNHTNFSIPFIKVTGILVETSLDLKNKINNIFTKQGLITQMMSLEKYENKKFYLFILMKIKIHQEQMENFQIQEILLNLFEPQIMKLPSSCVKMVDRSSLSKAKQIKFLQIFDQISGLLTNTHIKTSNEEDYFNYLLQNSQYQQSSPSLLPFIVQVIKKWSFKYKSQRLQKLIKYLQKLIKFLQFIFNENNSKFHQKILFQLELIYISLSSINPLQKQLVHTNCKQTICEEDKELVISFYYQLAQIIIYQKISITTIAQVFKVTPSLISAKRSGENICLQKSQFQFMKMFQSLKKHIKNQKQYSNLLETPKFYRLIRHHKNKQTKMIDIYPFLERLCTVLQNLRNINIKKQVSSIYEDHYDESQSKKAGEYSTEMIEDIDEYYRLNMNQYSSNLYSREIQLKNQIQKFCEVALQNKSILNLRSNQVNQIIEKNIANLALSTINQEIASSASWQTYGKIHYNFVLTIFRCFILKISQKLICPQIIQNLYNFLKQFAKQPNLELISFIQTFLNHYNQCPLVVQIFEIIIQDLYQAILNQIKSGIISSKIQLCLRGFIDIFECMLSSSYTSTKFRLLIKKQTYNNFISILSMYQVDSCLAYFYTGILQIMLIIWRKNYINDKDNIYNLLIDPTFLKWFNSLLFQPYFQKINKTTGYDLLMCRLINIVVQNYCEYYQQNPKLFKNSLQLDFSYVKENSSLLMKQTFYQKKISIDETKYYQGKFVHSPYLCKTQKLTNYDLYLISIIMNLFILIKIEDEHKEKSKRINLYKKSEIYNKMIITIVFDDEERHKKYSFKKPYLSQYLDKNIKAYILTEIQTIYSRNQKTQLYLKKLSDYLEQLLSLNAKFSNYLITKFIVIYKNQINLVLLFLNLTTYLIHISIKSSFSLQSSFTTLLFFIITLILTLIQIRFFYLKIKHDSNPKYSKLSNHMYEFTNSIPIQGEYSYEQKLFVNFKQIYYSNIYLYLILLITYVVCMIYQILTILLVVIHLLLFKKIRIILKQFMHDGLKRITFFVTYILLGITILSLMLFIIETKKGAIINTSYGQYTTKLFYEFYLLLCLGVQVGEAQELIILPRNMTVLIAFQFIIVSALLYLVYSGIKSVFELQRQQTQLQNRCIICCKHKQLFQKNGQDYQYHIKKQHNLWDYLFFIQNKESECKFQQSAKHNDESDDKQYDKQANL